MSVKVVELSKTYGAQKAVDSISFEARRGEVLGFLGPNGAGKTTTMKMITGFIPPTAGTAIVCDYDIRTDPMEVQRRVGYLPEHNPLYPEMYVKEYLEFIGGLHQLKNIRSRVGELIEMTGLQLEQHKRINVLSKGYRQRVGLAQAMLHDPEVLILDEPTSGLDPNQLAEIRSLIRKLGREKTVIFSTHIMQEVQAICDRVIIINRGRIVADDPIAKLQSRIKGASLVTVEFQQPVTAKKLSSIPQVKEVIDLKNNRWQLTATAAQDIRPAIFDFAVKNNLVLLELRKEEVSVEDVFRELTV